MTFPEIMFWMMGVGAFISGFLVISSKNPVHSIFSLVLVFLNTSILLILQGVEFLSLLFLIVYVGAIAILFLFVVMMLNIKLVEITDNATRYVPIGIIFGIIFLLEISLIMDKQFLNEPELLRQITNNYNDVYTNCVTATNLTVLGEVLYTEYVVYFIVASFVLLVAMIGAIVLTLTHEESVRRQDLFTQIATSYTKTIKLKC